MYKRVLIPSPEQIDQLNKFEQVVRDKEAEIAAGMCGFDHVWTMLGDICAVKTRSGKTRLAIDKSTAADPRPGEMVLLLDMKFQEKLSIFDEVLNKLD